MPLFVQVLIVNYSQTSYSQAPFRHIALWSPAPRQGKSTVASFLAETRGYQVLSFASPLLAMIHTLLLHHGLTEEEARYYCLCAKEQPIPVPGLRSVSYRQLARTLGTEWGRNLIKETIWLDAFDQKFRRYSSQSPICVDDVRFSNEASLLKKKGFLFVKVESCVDRFLEPANHQSDTELASFAWDHVIKNDGSMNELHQAVNQLFT